MRNLLIILFTFLLFNSCSHRVYDVLTWQNKNVKIDGVLSEWNDPLRFYDPGSKINFVVANDSQNLYVCFKVLDETEQLKILRNGMEFRIDTAGKKKFPTALFFPLAKNRKRSKSDEEQQPQQQKKSQDDYDRAAQIKKMTGEAKDMKLFGFKVPDGETPVLNTSGITAAMTIDATGMLFYEAVIPFNTFYKNKLTMADTNRIFSFQLKVNALPAPEHFNSGGGGGGMGGRSGMGGGGMGGMGGGRGGMSGGHGGTYTSSGPMYEANEITTKMKLSFK